MPRRQHSFRNLFRRGSALSLTIIVSVIITGLVMTMAWSAGVQASMTSNITRMDSAFYAAEAGAQRVAWYAKNNKLDTISSPLTGLINGYAYSTSWTLDGQAVAITSRGSLGDVSYTCHLTVIPPPVVVPTFSSGGDFDNKNLKVTGDLQCGGNYSNSGSAYIHGNLIYGGTASNLNDVTGTVTKANYDPLDIDALITYLQGFAGTTYSGNQTNKSFNFNTTPGTPGKKVIFVDGNVSNPTFTGTGTLVVTGNVTNVNSIGTSPAPVNIVAKGNINTNSNTNIYGTFYTGGSWFRQKMNLYGMVYVNGISPSNPGASNLVMTSPAWFDPRIDVSGRGRTRFVYFSGPQP